MAYQGQNYFQKRTKPKGPKANERIRAPQVQVISSDGKNLGTLDTREAINIAKDGSKKIPVMLHRALFGSLERFIGILIEHYAGKLPLWMAPLQVVVLPIASEFDNYAKEIFEQCLKAGINAEVDLKNQKINYKIREYSLSKVPLLLICGQKEVKDKTVTIRNLGSEKQETLSLSKAVEQISKKIKLPLN